jgi:integrase
MIKILTALDCERHQAGVLTDAKCPGLRLVATPGAGANGVPLRSWIYRYRRRDRSRGQIKLGVFPRMSLAEARAAWVTEKKIRDDPARGDPRGARRQQAHAQALARARAYTVRQMLEDYFRLHAAGLAKGQEQERMLRHDVLPKWGTRAAADITPREVVDLAEAVADRAPRVAEMCVSALRMAFAKAIERHRLPGPNPCAGVRVGSYAPRERAFSDEELRALLPWLEKDAKLSRTVRDALMLTLLTGARSGEVAASEWAEIDLEGAVWTQPKGKTKNRRTHRVMLAPQAVALLGARRSLHARWVFPSREEGHIAQKVLGVAQFAVRDHCPVKEWTVHDLRRSALTGLARLGCPRVIQDRIANHVDRSIAAIYDRHDYDDEAREWLCKWADHLDGLRNDPGQVAQSHDPGRTPRASRHDHLRARDPV